jgi:hypothetical protein
MTKNAVPAIAAALLLSTLMALAEPIERHEVFVKDGDTVIIGPGVEGTLRNRSIDSLVSTPRRPRAVSVQPKLRRVIVRPLGSSLC